MFLSPDGCMSIMGEGRMDSATCGFAMEKPIKSS